MRKTNEKRRVLYISKAIGPSKYDINAQGDIFYKGSYRKAKIEPTKQQHMITQAKRLCHYGKHAGSKPTWKLRNSIRQVDIALQNPWWKQ